MWFDLATLELLKGYAPIVLFFVLSLFLACFLVVVSLVRGEKRPSAEKLSPYECGFEPFGDARMKFDVRFYLVAILFIIFDLEISFLFPWAVAFQSIGVFGFISMSIFLFVLALGFFYEWRKGALEWE